jgi:putative hydrolase of the HAD superfamily
VPASLPVADAGHADAGHAGDGRRLHAVFFDAGDTLLAAHPTFQHRFVEVAEENGVQFEKAAVDAAYAEAIRRAKWPLDWADAAGQRQFWTGFYVGILADLGYSEDLDVLAQAMYDAFSDPAGYRLFADALPVLDELERRGIVLGLVSNFEPWLREVLELQGVLDRFSAVAISGELGVAKPDPAIFRHALDEAGIRPEHAVYVGDSPDADVAGARAAGIDPVLIDRFGRYPVVDAPRITALPELLPLLDGDLKGSARDPGGV